MFSEHLKRIDLHKMYDKPIDLMKAVKNEDLDEILGAFCREQQFTIKDQNGNNILHVAAKKGKRTACRAICGLVSHLDLWNQKNKEGKTPIDVATDKIIIHDLRKISAKNSTAESHNSNANKKLVEKKLQETKSKNNLKVLLSLDGGGMRVVLQCAILLQIERAIGEPLRNRVHWLAGTSCGGVMSASIGAGLDLKDCFKMFLAVRERIFCGNTKMLPRHKSEGIEGVLQLVIGKKTVMKDVNAHRLVVTTAKIELAPPQLVLFRSYAPRITQREFEQLGYLDPDKILLWKSLRCTSAAPTYFSSFNGMADGAIFCNNPCILLITEFLRLKKIENYRGMVNNDEIGCIISVGTGMEPSQHIEGGIDLETAFSIGAVKEMATRFKNLLTVITYQCTTSHNVHVGMSREWAHSMNIPFYRFSPRLPLPFELDTSNLKMIFDNLFEVEVYIRQINDEILEVARLLKQMPKNEHAHSQTHIL